MKTNILFVVAAAISIWGVAGCDSKQSNWDLVATKDGLVYRMDKQSGQVWLITGNQAIRVEEMGSAKRDDAPTNRVVAWREQENKQLGGVKFKVRTNWRGGKLYYIFQVSPYVGRIESELHRKTGSNAQFFIRLFDRDGFGVMTIPVRLSEMGMDVDESGKTASLSLNTAMECSLETYEVLNTCVVAWGGFEE